MDIVPKDVLIWMVKISEILRGRMRPVYTVFLRDG